MTFPKRTVKLVLFYYHSVVIDDSFVLLTMEKLYLNKINSIHNKRVA